MRVLWQKIGFAIQKRLPNIFSPVGCFEIVITMRTNSNSVVMVFCILLHKTSTAQWRWLSEYVGFPLIRLVAWSKWDLRHQIIVRHQGQPELAEMIETSFMLSFGCRNWYQHWGHCCLIRAKPEGCRELPRSLMRQQWPKLRYQFLFYHDETNLIMNKQILSIQMLKTVPGYSMVTCAHRWVVWPDCFSLVTRVATIVMSQWSLLH